MKKQQQKRIIIALVVITLMIITAWALWKYMNTLVSTDAEYLIVEPTYEGMWEMKVNEPVNIKLRADKAWDAFELYRSIGLIDRHFAWYTMQEQHHLMYYVSVFNSEEGALNNVKTVEEQLLNDSLPEGMRLQETSRIEPTSSELVGDYSIMYQEFDGDPPKVGIFWLIFVRDNIYVRLACMSYDETIAYNMCIEEGNKMVESIDQAPRESASELKERTTLWGVPSKDILPHIHELDGEWSLAVNDPLEKAGPFVQELNITYLEGYSREFKSKDSGLLFAAVTLTHNAWQLEDAFNKLYENHGLVNGWENLTAPFERINVGKKGYRVHDKNTGHDIIIFIQNNAVVMLISNSTESALMQAARISSCKIAKAQDKLLNQTPNVQKYLTTRDDLSINWTQYKDGELAFSQDMDGLLRGGFITSWERQFYTDESTLYVSAQLYDSQELVSETMEKNRNTLEEGELQGTDVEMLDVPTIGDESIGFAVDVEHLSGKQYNIVFKKGWILGQAVCLTETNEESEQMCLREAQRMVDRIQEDPPESPTYTGCD